MGSRRDRLSVVVVHDHQPGLLESAEDFEVVAFGDGMLPTGPLPGLVDANEASQQLHGSLFAIGVNLGGRLGGLLRHSVRDTAGRPVATLAQAPGAVLHHAAIRPFE